MQSAPRNRMISFRLTELEYDHYRELSVSCGMRGVSELVRAAVNQMVVEPYTDLSTFSKEIQARVATLESRLGDLSSKLVEAGLTPPQSGSPNDVGSAVETNSAAH